MTQNDGKNVSVPDLRRSHLAEQQEAARQDKEAQGRKLGYVVTNDPQRWFKDYAQQAVPMQDSLPITQSGKWSLYRIKQP